MKNAPMARHALAATPLSVRLGKIIASTVMNMLALLGVVCIVLVILAFTVKITLIMFQTGSMSPGIPTGSVAVVQQIPAAEIEIGDVVTVDREGDLPVTHRVTSVSISEALGNDARIITMRGDANEVDDPQPYTVETVRKVLVSVPGLAPVIVWFSQPVVLGVITLGAGVLVTIAFWPKTTGSRSALRRRHSHTEQRELQRSGNSVGSALIFAIVIGSFASALPAVPAQAVEQVSVRHGFAVVLTSIADPALMRGMLPETPVYWQVGIQRKFPEINRITAAVAAEGDASLGLHVRALVCTQQWEGTHCPSGSSPTVFSGPAAVGAGYLPVTDSAGDDLWVLFEAVMPEDGRGEVTLSAQITSSSADDTDPNAAGTTVEMIAPAAPLDAHLSSTGLYQSPWLPVLGLVSVAGGLTVAGAAKMRQIMLAGGRAIH